jgi:hypothetical protein
MQHNTIKRVGKKEDENRDATQHNEKRWKGRREGWVERKTRREMQPSTKTVGKTE